MQQSATQSKLYFTEEQYLHAREECSALEYAHSRGYPLVRKGHYYEMKDHDSMVFTQDGRWFWNSRSLKGRAIEFIMHYEDRTLPEAVQILNQVEGQTYADVRTGRKIQRPKMPRVSYTYTEPKRKVRFKLPKQSENFRRLFGYLCGTRKLDSGILKDLVQQGSLYESCYTYTDPSTGELKEIHNAVFVGRDDHGEPKSAFQRGLSSFGKNSSYKRDVSGSDPSVAFCLPGRKDVQSVIVFEASIDAISHACIYKDAGLDYKNCDRIALGGTEKTVGLTTYLQNHPQITRVAIAMDEDTAGRIADQKIRAILSGKPYEVSSLRQSVGKDWNDYLVQWRQVAEQCSTYPTTRIIGTPSGKPAGRIHYLDKRGAVITTEAFGNKNAYQHQIKRCFSSGQRVVAETSEQQERIQQTKAYRPPSREQTKSVPEHDIEMEL